MTATKLNWKRSKTAIYRTDCGQFTAYSVPFRKEWVVYDNFETERRARYFVNLTACKRWAESRKEGKV